MLDVDRRSALHASTTPAVRPESLRADAADEGRVAARIAEGGHLDEERREPEVRVVGVASPKVWREGFERIGCRAPADAECTFACDIRADRLAVAPEVAGDGRNRPAPPCECVGLHVFSLCEHRPGLHPVVGPDRQRGPIRVLRPGRFGISSGEIPLIGARPPRNEYRARRRRDYEQPVLTALNTHLPTARALLSLGWGSI